MMACNRRAMTEPTRPPVRGVVLAGGRSTRFGEADKALATLKGRPLVARVVDAVTAATDDAPLLSVATDAQADRLREALGDRPVEPVRDSEHRSGPLAGLDAAVRATDAPWLFVCACDMPRVTPAGVDALSDRLADHEGRDSVVDAVVPLVDGRDQPLHALYRRSALESALAALSGDDAVFALLDRLTVARVDAGDGSPLAAATTNVNTRADLEALRESRRSNR